MIQLKKRPNPPESLSGQAVQKKIKDLRVLVESGTKPDSHQYNNYWSSSREILWKHQNRKCCYCERIRELKRESDLEHFRPKAKITEEPTHFGYWWLAYNFDNYLYSCKICNEDFKKNLFPLIEPSSRAFLETDNLELETKLLIDPYTENPEVFLGYYWGSTKSKYVKVLSLESDVDKRGEKSAEITGLNRDSLMTERASFLLTLQSLVTIMNYAEQRENGKAMIEKTHKQILEETSSKKSFTGFRRFFFIHNDLGQYIAND